MPPEYTILIFGFGGSVVSNLTWFSAYGGGVPPTGTAIEDRVTIGMRVGVTEREVNIGGF